MSANSLEQFCDLVSNVAIKNAITLQQRFSDLVTPYVGNLNSEYIFKTFAFMNYTFAIGVWSTLQNERLRRDLIVELKTAILLKIAKHLATPIKEEIAAKGVFLNDDFNLYLEDFKKNMKSYAYHDAGTARVFALERIQKQHGINDLIMNDIVPKFFADETLNSEVESVAMNINKVAY